MVKPPHLVARRFVASGAMNNMLQSQAVQGPSLLLTGLVLKVRGRVAF